jgi:hypothetical protein
MTCYNSELPIGPPGPTGPQGPSGIINVSTLPILNEAESDDILYIIDTSTGTSSQIELGNIVNSGSYTPLFAVQSGSFGVGAIGGVSWYNKSGNFVQFFFKLRIEFDTDSIAYFRITLPFSTNLTTYDSIAICNLIEPQTTGGAVILNTNNGNGDQIEFQFETENSSSDTYEFNLIANYVII